MATAPRPSPPPPGAGTGRRADDEAAPRQLRREGPLPHLGRGATLAVDGVFPGTPHPRQPVHVGPDSPLLPRAFSPGGRPPRDRARAARDGRAVRRLLLRDEPADSRRRAEARAVGRVGQPDRRHRDHTLVAGSSARRDGEGRRRHRLRAQARRALPHSPVRAGLPLRRVDRGLHVPARDDRRRRQDAVGARQQGPRGPRPAAADEPRSRPRVDQRAMDDRAHRRLGRGHHRDGRAQGRRHLAPLRHQVVHERHDVADGADAGAARGQPAGRPRPGALLRRDARRPGAPAEHPGQPPQGQARHAHGADRRAHARRRSPWWA
jgi:hypothetical protein